MPMYDLLRPARSLRAFVMTALAMEFGQYGLSGCSSQLPTVPTLREEVTAEAIAVDGVALCDISTLNDANGNPTNPAVIEILQQDPAGSAMASLLNNLTTPPTQTPIGNGTAFSSEDFTTIFPTLSPPYFSLTDSLYGTMLTQISMETLDACLLLYKSLVVASATTNDSKAPLELPSGTIESDQAHIDSFPVKVLGATTLVEIAAYSGVGLAWLAHRTFTTCNEYNEQTYCPGVLTKDNSTDGIPDTMTQTQCGTYCSGACGTKGIYLSPSIPQFGQMCCTPSEKKSP